MQAVVQSDDPRLRATFNLAKLQYVSIRGKEIQQTLAATEDKLDQWTTAVSSAFFKNEPATLCPLSYDRRYIYFDEAKQRMRFSFL